MIERSYTEINGLLSPDIKVDDEELFQDLGKYGELRFENTCSMRLSTIDPAYRIGHNPAASSCIRCRRAIGFPRSPG